MRFSRLEVSANGQAAPSVVPAPAPASDSPAGEPRPKASSLREFVWNSVRGRLSLLVIALTLPALAVVGVLTFQAYRNERETAGRHLAATNRALSLLLDQKLTETATFLQGLALSLPLQTDDLEGFDTRARFMLQNPAAKNRWIILLTPDGRQVVNTLAAFGTPLPSLPLPPAALEALSNRQLYISDVTISPVLQRPMLYVAMPILRDGTLKYVLLIATRSDTFSEEIDLAHIVPGCIVSIVDRQGVVGARTLSGERFVGTKISERFAQAIAGRTEAVMESTTLDNIEVLTAMTRSSMSGWATVTSAPRAELYASAERLLWLGFAVSALLLSVAIFMAAWIGRALVRSVDVLVTDTDAIGRGEVPPVRSSGLAEMDFVADAMRRSAVRLAEKERDNVALNSALQVELANQRKAEEASRRLAAIVESSADAIIGKTLDGVISSWNKGAEQIFGYTADEVIGQPMSMLIPPDRVDEERAILAGIPRHQQVAELETVRRRKDGTLVDISLTVSPVVDKDGRPIGASSIARNISERKRNESQQHALYELVAAVNRAAQLPEVYEAALNALARCQSANRVGILLRDGQGVMRFMASRGLSETYRRAVEGHSPWSDADPAPEPIWFDDVRAAELEPNIAAALAAEGIRAIAFVPLTYEQQLLGKFMLYHDAPHTFERQELRPVETVASQVAFAIARQKSAEALEALVSQRTASLQEAVAQMQEFSYSVSHDLRAPVRAMCGYAEAVLEDHGEKLDPEARGHLQRILRSGARMDRLIQDLLTYSRISRREMPLEPVSLDKLVSEVVQQYPAMQPEQADIEIGGPLPDVIGHEPSLTQVLSNLLSNAVKFVPKNSRPRVVIHAERRATRVRLSLRDNGIGIKPEHQSRLFGMFERVHADQHYDGTGIGLAIVRRAVERMNGTVGVESDGVTGSRFWVELPLADSTPGSS